MLQGCRKRGGHRGPCPPNNLSSMNFTKESVFQSVKLKKIGEICLKRPKTGQSLVKTGLNFNSPEHINRPSNDNISETTGLFPSNFIRSISMQGEWKFLLKVTSLGNQVPNLKKSSPRSVHVVGFQFYFHRNIYQWTGFQILLKKHSLSRACSLFRIMTSWKVLLGSHISLT